MEEAVKDWLAPSAGHFAWAECCFRIKQKLVFRAILYFGHAKVKPQKNQRRNSDEKSELLLDLSAS